MRCLETVATIYQENQSRLTDEQKTTKWSIAMDPENPSEPWRFNGTYAISCNGTDILEHTNLPLLNELCDLHNRFLFTE